MSKGCDNCYYSYFDEKAYPCSLCIRGIERTDKWMPSKKTKAEIQTDRFPCNNCKNHDECCTKEFECKYEPQTETEIETQILNEEFEIDECSKEYEELGLKKLKELRKDEPQICDTCRYYNSNIPCGSTPSACKEADKFAEEFVDGLKKLKPKDESQTERSE